VAKADPDPDPHRHGAVQGGARGAVLHAPSVRAAAPAHSGVRSAAVHDHSRDRRAAGALRQVTTRTMAAPADLLALTKPRIVALAWILGSAGVAELATFVNVLTAVLAAATLIVYVGAYTPLKRRSHLATLVGAVPGALPIVGGWTASGAPLDARAMALFAIMF